MASIASHTNASVPSSEVQDDELWVTYLATTCHETANVTTARQSTQRACTILSKAPRARSSTFNILRSFAFTASHSRKIIDRKSTRLNSSHVAISYAVFCLKKK